MQNKGVLHALHSLQFRVHTTVFITLFVACFGLVVIWSSPTPGLPRPPTPASVIADSNAKVFPAAPTF